MRSLITSEWTKRKCARQNGGGEFNPKGQQLYLTDRGSLGGASIIAESASEGDATAGRAFHWGETGGTPGVKE